MAATKKKEKKNAMAVINQHIKSGEFAKIYLFVRRGEISRKPVQG